MYKLKKIISKFLLILCPASGFFMVASLISGHWYFIFPLILVVVLVLNFYFYTNRIEHLRGEIKYNRWKKEFSKTHEYLGITPYYEDEVWRNKLTGEIIER